MNKNMTPTNINFITKKYAGAIFAKNDDILVKMTV